MCTCSPRQAQESVFIKSDVNNAEKSAFHMTCKGLRRSWEASATGPYHITTSTFVCRVCGSPIWRWFAAHRLSNQRSLICFYFPCRPLWLREKNRDSTIPGSQIYNNNNLSSNDNDNDNNKIYPVLNLSYLILDQKSEKPYLLGP